MVVTAGQILEKTGFKDQIRIGYSIFINYDLGEYFDEVYLMVIREVMGKLNDAGRNGERITWLQGPAIPGKPFPLAPEYNDEGTQHYIHATCRIPAANVKTGV